MLQMGDKTQIIRRQNTFPPYLHNPIQTSNQNKYTPSESRERYETVFNTLKSPPSLAK